MTDDFATRVFNLLKRRKESGAKLTKDQLAEALGCSRTMLYNYEQGEPPPPAEILSTLSTIERTAGIEHSSSIARREEPNSYRPVDKDQPRRIKIIGWAHAGDAEAYDEIPGHWQDAMATDCPKERAFGVKLEGDSMEPKFSDGDILVVMPDERAYSGCFAVVKFKDDGVLFRRLEVSGTDVRLVPLNERYLASSHSPEDFAWIFPVWGRFTQLWTR